MGILAATTSSIPNGFFEAVWFLLLKYYPWFVSGILVTVKIAFFGTLFGFLLGCVITAGRQFKSQPQDSWLTGKLKKALNFILTCYVEFFRGTPMIVQASFIYYFGLNQLNLGWHPETAGIVVVSLNTAAYIAEILRGGINSVDSGQEEAARAIGMNQIQAMLYVVFPQGIKNSIPAIANEFIVNIKDSSVLSAISVVELYRQGNLIIGVWYRQSEVFFIVSIFYLICTLIISRVFKLIEKRWNLDSNGTNLPTSASLPTHYKTTKGGTK